MKGKYLALAGLAGLAAFFYFSRTGRKGHESVAARSGKRTVTGEKHIRGIMKRSKLTGEVAG